MQEQKRTVLFYIIIALIVLSISIAIVPGCTEADGQRLFEKTTGIIMVSDLKFYALDPETGKITRLTPSIKGITSIQYQAGTKNLVIGVKDGVWYACKADGSNITKLNIKPTKSRWSLLPSPDLTKVMFDEVTYKTDAPGYEHADKAKVIIKDIRSGREKELLRGDGGSCHLSGWSPDSKTVYFYWRGQTFYRSISKADFGRAMGLWIRDMNWSDDGKRIIADVIYGGEPAVITCKPDGTDVHVLASAKEIINPKTQQRFDAEWPTISHDGKHVAFTALDVNPREWHVFVVPSRGDARVRVSPAGTRGVKEVGNRSRPFWSPDDSRVAFLDGNHLEGYRLFVVDAGRGKGATKGTVQSFNIPFKKTKWKNIEEATRKIPRGHDYSYLQPYIISWQ